MTSEAVTYVALLRGINVGGNRKVDMKLLKATFEGLGLTNVRTYINSGNVLFASERDDPRELVREIETAIERDFGFTVAVQLRDSHQIATLVEELPDEWANDDAAKCDVMFLSEEIDAPDIVERLTVKPDVDEVLYVPGVVFWRIERPKATRSGITKIIGTPLYAAMTVRNCNTLRKLDSLMRS